MASGDHVALALLAMAETLRTQTPPKFKMAIKCLMGCFKQSMSNELTAHCHFEIGKLYYFYTENLETAKMHLETSYRMMLQIGDLFKESRLHSLCLIGEIYMVLNQGNTILNYLKNELQHAKAFPLIYNKMILMYAEICTLDDNTQNALGVLEMGIQSSQDPVMHCYYRLTKNLVTTRISDVGMDQDEAMNLGQLIKSLPAEGPNTVNIRLYLVATQLAFLLSRGQAKSAKQLLRQMQQEVQSLTNLPPLPQGIVWSEFTVMTILACTMTVVSSALQCSMERATKYYGIAMKHLQEFTRKASQKAYEPGIARTLDRMRLVLDEVMAHMHIVSCQPRLAMNNVRNMLETCVKCPVLASEYYPIAHVILGLYSMYCNETEMAEKQLVEAVMGIKDRSLYVIANLHLALFYLTQANSASFYDVADRITLRQCENMSPIVRAAALLVHSFQCMAFNKSAEFKQHVTDCLTVTRNEDMFRLHTMACLLFCTVFSGQPAGVSAIEPTMQWTLKSGDHSWLLWTYQLIDEHHQRSNTEPKEAVRKGLEVEKSALSAGRFEAVNDNGLHDLVQWLNGSPLDFLPRDL